MSAKKSPARGRKRKARPVGRPRKSGSSGSDTPAEEILKVASHLFSTKGYAGTTMAEIADVVGIRGPSLYYHFQLKSDILRTLADLGLGGAVSIGEKYRNETSLTAAARLHQLIDEVVVSLRSADYEFNCLFDPVFQDKEFRDVNMRITAWMKELKRFVVDGVDSGQLAMDDTELATYAVRSLIQSCVRDLGQFTAVTPDEMGRHIADFSLKAIVKNESTLKSLYKELDVYHAAA